MPIRKDDEVRIMRGSHAGKEGKVTCCHRSKYVINVEKVTRDKANGSSVAIPIHPSKVMITKLKLDESRKKILDRKDVTKRAPKGKFTEADVKKTD